MTSQPSPPTVSIVVVSFNTREMTLDCLRSVYAETRTPFELIVVDNASSDGSAEAIAAEFPEAKLLAEGDNHGFAKANNIAARHATGEYLLLLNPDTVVLDGAIDKLLAFARRRPEARIWGGRTLFGDRALNPGSCFARMTLWNVFCRSSGLSRLFSGSALFNAEDFGAWRRDSERQVDIVCGCFFLIPTAFWHELGGFDLQFVMYGEESDLCLRAAQRGARPAVTPDSVIVHYGGASDTVRVDKMVRLLSAKALLIKRHFPAWQRGLGLWLFRLWPLNRWLLLAFAARLTGKPGHREAAAHWRRIWNRRNEWQGGWPGPDTGGLPA